MPPRTRARRTESATSGEAAAGRSNSSSSDRPSSGAIAARNNRRETLLALRNRLAAELDEDMWAKHKADCICQCGMSDERLIIALTKELRATEAELAALPAEEEKSDLDLLADELAPRRAGRRAVASGL